MQGRQLRTSAARSTLGVDLWLKLLRCDFTQVLWAQTPHAHSLRCSGGHGCAQRRRLRHGRLHWGHSFCDFNHRRWNTMGGSFVWKYWHTKTIILELSQSCAGCSTVYQQRAGLPNRAPHSSFTHQDASDTEMLSVISTSKYRLSNQWQGCYVKACDSFTSDKHARSQPVSCWSWSQFDQGQMWPHACHKFQFGTKFGMWPLTASTFPPFISFFLCLCPCVLNKGGEEARRGVEEELQYFIWSLS